MDTILAPGDIISSGEYTYRIIRYIGRGSSAVAYMAECIYGGLDYICILKEYNPSGLNIIRNEDASLSCDDTDEFKNGMERFLQSGIHQNEIRQKINMRNQTPPVSRSFRANGTAYSDVTCYDGDTLDRLTDLSLTEYTRIIISAAKNVSAYHSASLLCLDLKPENIFIMFDAAGNAVTQLIEFIDFDSIRDEKSTDKFLSYTHEWAAPEQTNSCTVSKISRASDIYTLGELAFWIYFGRHSKDSEHRGFSKYDFDSCVPKYRSVFSRPYVQDLLTKLFRNTLRPSVSNRFSSVNDVISILEKIAEEAERKEYIIPVQPYTSPFFTGRDNEIRYISEKLKETGMVWLYGTGGIGKSTILRNYVRQKRSEYDVVICLEFFGSIVDTFCDETQIRISTVRKNADETYPEYFRRKLEALRMICADKSVLLVIDNFTGLITKEFSELINNGWHTLAASRRDPPLNSFSALEIKAFSETEDIYSLISLNLGRQVTESEKPFLDRIIKLTEGHTLVLELIARQIKAGNIDIRTALELIEENGLSLFSDEKISSYKDYDEIYDTLYEIISSLFRKGNMSDRSAVYLKVLALTDLRGMKRSILHDIVRLDDDSILSGLSDEGWIYDGDTIRVHPVIAEAVRGWIWPASEKDISVMKYHKRVIAVYEGMEDVSNILRAADSAGKYSIFNDRDIIYAMAQDMMGSFYDAVIGGAYDSDDEDDREIIKSLIICAEEAVKYSSHYQNTEEKELHCTFLLSLASLYIRTGSEPEDDSAYKCLEKAYSLISHDFENYADSLCSYHMVSAWYYTLKSCDIEKVSECIEKAAVLANEAYRSELEIIDIFHIPAADCYFTLGENERSVTLLSEAADICRAHPDTLQYTDKLAELLRCLLDVYFSGSNYEKCRELITEINLINEKYADQGIYREINQFIVDTVCG